MDVLTVENISLARAGFKLPAPENMGIKPTSGDCDAARRRLPRSKVGFVPFFYDALYLCALDHVVY
jgi:hypothetical protein